jgi:hypothetical protein
MRPRRRFQFAVLTPLALVLCSCTQDGPAATARAVVDTLANGAVHVRNTADGVWALEGVAPWRLEEELRIGQLDGGGPYMFGQVRNVIPNVDGSIWVLESQVPELRLFSPEGRFVRAVGGQGEGPGEFSGNVCAFSGLNDEIWVEDLRGRWQRFDRAGELLGQLTSTSNLGCGIRRLAPGGRLLVVSIRRSPESPMSSTSFYVEHRLDSGGELVAGDTFATPVLPSPRSVTWVSPRGGRIISNLPFTHRPWSILGTAGFFHVTPGGGPYLIQRLSLDGDTLLVMERAYEPISVSDSTRERTVREFQREGYSAAEGFDPGEVPRVYPPFDQIWEATDGSLWVRRPLDGGAMGLDVFTPDGIYLGEVAVPDDFGRMLIHHITPEHMYAVARDELDVPYVVRLAIQRPDG